MQHNIYYYIGGSPILILLEYISTSTDLFNVRFPYMPSRIKKEIPERQSRK